MKTLDEVLDAVMELPTEQQEMLIQIVHQRRIENRREEIVQTARESIAEFRSGKLKPQTAEEVIKDLRSLLETDER
jgi:hypothetical protein